MLSTIDIESKKHNMSQQNNAITVFDLMSSSTQSLSSSLASPGDSGVQLLDSEASSDITSIMSTSGHDFKTDDTNCMLMQSSLEDGEDDDMNSHRISVILNEDYQLKEAKIDEAQSNQLEVKQNLMTISDIANQNVSQEIDVKIYSQSAPAAQFMEPPPPGEHTYEDKDVSVESPVKTCRVEDKNEEVITNPDVDAIINEDVDVMQTSTISPMIDSDQIVYRRQRRKKVKSQDTPKKRVSFHEDILNSTKIDDIHIDRGFITRHDSPGGGTFYTNKYKNTGVVLGRYSWAAEGDTSYYNCNTYDERDVQSDLIYDGGGYHSLHSIPNRTSSMSSSDSTSSSSSTLSSSSANDVNDDEDVGLANGILNGIKNIKKVPKSSCLKKPKNGVIDTKIVEENNRHSFLTRKISESQILLDRNNIFGSLKNIYKTLSSSVPLAQRGVPEGQEDSTTNEYSSHSYNDSLYSKSLENYNYMNNVQEVEVVDPTTPTMMQTAPIGAAKTMYKKPNLRLSRSEGFYPNYPIDQSDNCPDNIILCDSNVYEHRGISYSYEYDQYQQINTIANQAQNKSKGSTVYQMLLDEISFLKKSKSPTTVINSGASLITTPNDKDSATSTPKKHSKDKNQQSTSVNDWGGSDSESVSDIFDKSTASSTSKHLQSPLKKRNKLKSNHYSIQQNKLSISTDIDSQHELLNLNQSTILKSSLINRFLRNVTQRQLIDETNKQMNKRLQNKLINTHNNLLNLYNIDKATVNVDLANQLNVEIEEELIRNRKQTKRNTNDSKYQRIQDKIMRQTCSRWSPSDDICHIYKVKSLYNMTGELNPLLLLITTTTLFVYSLNKNKTEYYNEFMIPIKEIHFILIGPNRQTIYITNNRRTLNYFIITSDREQTTDIVARLSIIMKYQSIILPAIKEFTLNDMIQMRCVIYQQTAVSKDEDFYHYNIIHIEDEEQLTALQQGRSPLGPSHDGFLMYRKAQTNDRWLFGYFILKAGVLYMFTSPSTRIPLKVIQLTDGECYGVHRTQPNPRPHTFEVISKTESLEFAASDEYEASDWLQALVQSASGMHIVSDDQDAEEMQASACSLILTTSHLITIRECFNNSLHADLNSSSNASPLLIKDEHQVLSCAIISDLTSFKIPSTTDANDTASNHCWCILEFSCQEVCETSGDWIIYFSSNIELQEFLSTFQVLWSYSNTQTEKFPLTIINDCTDPIVYRHASDTNRLLQHAWIHFQ